jgi:hypothetical protein
MWPFTKKPLQLTTDQLEAFNDLISDCVPFGSQVWGGAKKKSDYDYLCDYDHIDVIVKFLDKRGVKRTSVGAYNNALGCDYLLETTVNGKLYQFVTYSNWNGNVAYNKFVLCVSMMSNYSLNHDVSNKKLRYKTFEQIFDVHFYGRNENNWPGHDYLREHFPEYYI